jgi:hypothetical protein
MNAPPININIGYGRRSMANLILKYVERFAVLIHDIHRVLKPNGELHIKVPYFSNPCYYSDYAECCFFGLYTFDYFVPRERQISFYSPFAYATACSGSRSTHWLISTAGPGSSTRKPPVGCLPATCLSSL